MDHSTTSLGNDKILLILLPFWTPLIPPQGICRIKSALQKNGYRVKTIDTNLQVEVKRCFDKYFYTLFEAIPADKRGNFYNIIYEVLREHSMAHINYKDKNEYHKLVKQILYSVFYHDVADSDVLKLQETLDEYFLFLKNYLKSLLEHERPYLLGISTYRDTLASSLFAFRTAREILPQVVTVMGGGIFATQLQEGSPDLEFFLEKTGNYIDKIMIGKGEEILLFYLRGDLPADKRVYTNKDVPSLALENKSIPADLADFSQENYFYLAGQTSSGCSNRCSFCNVASFFGEYTEIDLDAVVEEMREKVRKHNKQLFFMIDALLNPVIDKFASKLLEEEMRIYFDAYLRVDHALCDINKVMLWKQGGLYRARIGVESGSQEMLNLMNKGITVEQIKSSVSNLALAGVKTTLYIVIGHPGETEKDFQQTLDLIAELKNDIYEAECNPFVYFYKGQAKNDEWGQKRLLLYPESSRDMLLCRTWIVDVEPSRELMFKRINRFVQHCKNLGVLTPWSLNDVNKADERWKKLHKNSVPSILELSSGYIDDRKRITGCSPAVETFTDAEEFHFE